MPASSSSPMHPVLDHLACAVDDNLLAGTGLFAALVRVADPRKRRGVRHQIGAILAVAVCAVLAGCRSFTAIGEWAANASEQVLAALAVGACPPCESTIRRTLQRLDGDKLDTAIRDWAVVRTEPPAGERGAVAIDGKTVRGSAGHVTDARHLLAAVDHRAGVVLGQVDAASKTNEITQFTSLCDRIGNLTDAVVTADALHTQKRPRRLSRAAAWCSLLAHRKRQPAHPAQPTESLALERTPTSTHLQRSCSRPDGTTHRQGRDRLGRDRLPTRPPGHPDHPQDPKAQQQEMEYRSGVRGHQPDRRAGHRRRTRRVGPRPLDYREPPALGARRHLRRRSLPDPHRHRTPRHGLPAQPRGQRPTNRWCHQHHPSHPTSRLRPTSPCRTPANQLKEDFAEAVPGQWRYIVSKGAKECELASYALSSGPG